LPSVRTARERLAVILGAKQVVRVALFGKKASQVEMASVAKEMAPCGIALSLRLPESDGGVDGGGLNGGRSGRDALVVSDVGAW